MAQRPITIKITDLGLVTFLCVKGTYPVSRSEDHGTAALHYEETAALDSEIVSYQKMCAVCGFAPIQFTRAQAEARRMLIDGTMPN